MLMHYHCSQVLHQSLPVFPPHNLKTWSFDDKCNFVLENWNFLVNGEAAASNLDDNPGNEEDFDDNNQASTFAHKKGTAGASIIGVSL